MICCNFVSSTVRLGLIFLSLTFFWWFVDAFQLYFCCKRWGSKRNLNAAPFGVMRKKGVPVPFDVNGSKGGQKVKGLDSLCQVLFARPAAMKDGDCPARPLCVKQLLCQDARASLRLICTYLDGSRPMIFRFPSHRIWLKNYCPNWCAICWCFCFWGRSTRGEWQGQLRVAVDCLLNWVLLIEVRMEWGLGGKTWGEKRRKKHKEEKRRKKDAERRKKEEERREMKH